MVNILKKIKTKTYKNNDLINNIDLNPKGSNMLKLSQLINATYNVEVDYYIPLTIEVSGIPSYAEKNYFRLVKENSLLEIGIDIESHQLMNIILVQISSASLVDQIVVKEIADKQGCPVFQSDISFTNGLHDINQSFDVFLSREILKIRLIDVEETSYLTNGRVKLGFSQDGILVSILLLDLTDKEYTDLKDSFKLY